MTNCREDISVVAKVPFAVTANTPTAVIFVRMATSLPVCCGVYVCEGVKACGHLCLCASTLCVQEIRGGIKPAGTLLVVCVCVWLRLYFGMELRCEEVGGVSEG